MLLKFSILGYQASISFLVLNYTVSCNLFKNCRQSANSIVKKLCTISQYTFVAKLWLKLWQLAFLGLLIVSNMNSSKVLLPNKI